MRRVFLTGASGFAGRIVAERLRARGHDVIGLSRSASGGGLLRGDLADESAYRDALTADTVLVHLAALTGVAPEAEYVRINVTGTAAVLAAAGRAGVNRVLFCSTIAAAFRDVRGYPYAQSKARAEQLVMQSGLRFTAVRPTILGGRGSPVMTRLAALARLPVVPLFGGRTRVQPLLVDDFADFVADIVDSDRFAGETLELGGPDVVTIRDLLARARRLQKGGGARFLPLPADAIAGVLRGIESVAGPVLPVTAGQFATFRFDGIARPNDLWEARRAQLASIDRIIEASLAS